MSQTSYNYPQRSTSAYECMRCNTCNSPGMPYIVPDGSHLPPQTQQDKCDPTYPRCTPTASVNGVAHHSTCTVHLGSTNALYVCWKLKQVNLLDSIQKLVSVIEMILLYYARYSFFLLRPKNKVKLPTQSAELLVCMGKWA